MYVIIKVPLLEKENLCFYCGGNVVSFDQMFGGCGMRRYGITDMDDRAVSYEVLCT